MADAPTNPERREELAFEMPFGDHLEELRRRLIFALVGIAPLFMIALLVGQPLMRMLFTPVLQAQLESGNPAQVQVTGQFEYFGTYVKVSLILTIIVGLPWVFFQAWKFVAPGLYAHEKRFAYTLLPMSVFLSGLGLVFMFKVMLPVVLIFFLNFNGSVPGVASPVVEVPSPALPGAVGMPSFDGDPVHPEPGQMWFNRKLNQVRFAVANTVPAAVEGAAAESASTPNPPEPAGASTTSAPDSAPDSDTKADASKPAEPEHADVTIWSINATRGDQLLRQEFRVSEYIETVFDFALAFAIAFQAPVAVLLLGWAGIIDPVMMTKYRRHAIMACVVVGAVLTPADPVSIFLLAIPLFLLYELGLALLRWLPASRVAGGFRGGRDGEPPEPQATGP